MGLEQNNLFLIQQAQDTEEALEKVRAQLNETKMRMDAELEILLEQIKTLQGAIEAEHLISARRRGRDKGSSWGSPTSPKKVSASHGSSAPSKGAAKGEGATETPSPEQLKQMIAHTYRNVDNMVDQSVDPIQMLTDIEKTLAIAMTDYESLPAERAKEAEKAKNKEKRDKKRRDKAIEQKAEQERRTQKVLDRATKPRPRRIGKPEMFRSVPPPRRTRKPVALDTDDSKEDESIYFS